MQHWSSVPLWGWYKPASVISEWPCLSNPPALWPLLGSQAVVIILLSAIKVAGGGTPASKCVSFNLTATTRCKQIHLAAIQTHSHIYRCTLLCPTACFFTTYYSTVLHYITTCCEFSIHNVWNINTCTSHPCAYAENNTNSTQTQTIRGISRQYSLWCSVFLSVTLSFLLVPHLYTDIH